MADIDIDFQTKFEPEQILKQAVPASMVKAGVLAKHPCGYYFQTIPVDPVTNLAAIPYEQAEEQGYFKIDFLHLSILDHFTSKQEIRELVNKQPNWNLLLDRDNVAKLFQIHKHYDVLLKVKPTSVDELSDCIALIRPGKKHLLEQYLKNKGKIRPQLYRQADDDKSAFKRSHALAYALTIVLQLHLIEQKKI